MSARLPPDPLRRRRIGSAFGRAARTYDAAATLQRRVADTLLDLLAPELSAALSPASCGDTGLHLLDAGCGTGHGAQRWLDRHPGLRITGVDLALDMVRQARPTLTAACVADMAALPFASGQFDAWWSNLAMQWCDPFAVLREAARVCRPGAWVAFSTLGPDTFWELRQARARLATAPGRQPEPQGDGAPKSGRPPIEFQSSEVLTQALREAGLHLQTHQHRHERVFHPTLRQLLHDLRAVGANVGGQDGRSASQPLGGRQAWNTLQAAYEIHRLPAGLPLTYDVHWVLARRT